MSKLISKSPTFFGLNIFKSLWKPATISFSALVIGDVLSKISVLILKSLTDSITASPVDTMGVIFWTVIYPAVFLIVELSWRVSGFSGMRLFMGFRKIASQELYDYLSLHSKQYFSGRFAGSLTNKIANAVDGTESFFENVLWGFTPLVITLLLYTVFSFYNNIWLGAIILFWSVFFIVANLWFAKKLQPSSIKSAKSESALKGKIVDSLSNISIVHEYANLRAERNYIGKYVNKAYDAGLAMWRLSEWMLTINGILIFIFVSAMLGTSVYLFLENTVTAGVIVMVIIITLDLSRQLIFLGQQIRNSSELFGKAREGLDEILQEHLIIDKENAQKLELSNSAIDFDSVYFKYQNNTVFKNFTLHIPAGQKIGLVGRSGSGKSTLIALLLRHYDIDAGAIKIDEQNIDSVTLESLRSSIGFVPQDTSLFHRSIKENIKYSRPDASDEMVVNAAKAAHAHEFIQDVPEKYEALVGERGVKLSGGQRQRIALARAFLKNASILILDEATSSLDSVSEKAVQDSLEKLMKGRTVIAVAHRLSTLKNMDRIVVLDEGRIIEDGTQNELLGKNNGLFKKLWDHQVKGFIVDE